jgi:TRAP-type C4-dicarboxylate transport system substrate-binding protein
MQKRRLVKLMGSICLILVPAALLLVTASVGPAAAKPITLKAISFIPVRIPTVHFLGPFADRVNARTKGELKIDWIGGPEVVPQRNQSEALRTGTIDIILTTHGVVPEGNVMPVSEYTPAEERKNGAYDWFNGVVQKRLNAYYMGRTMTENSIYNFANFPVQTPRDLAGRKISSIPLTNAGLEALGAVPVNVPAPERYSAVERGVVDGYALTVVGAVGYKLQPKTKIMIDHAYGSKNQIGIFVNLDKWKSLPKHLQKVMQEVAIEIESEAKGYYNRLEEKGRKSFLAAGTKFVKFSPADAKSYIDTLNNALWGQAKEILTAEVYAEAVRFLRK